jgi:octaprenyl-diphosphate synthase
MAPYRDMNITLAEATVALVEGETLQAQAAKDNTLNREIYQKIVAKKTASLFRAAGMLGAQLAEADRHAVEALGEFGFFLGLAFQIVDDLLDLTGDMRLMGKNAHVDVAQGKGVASAYGTSGNGHSRGGAASVMEVETTQDNDPFLAVKRRLIESGAVEEGREMARMIGDQALAALSHFPVSGPRSQLSDLVGLVLDRDR